MIGCNEAEAGGAGGAPTPDPSPRRFAPGEGSRVSARRDDRCKEIEASQRK